MTDTGSITAVNTDIKRTGTIVVFDPNGKLVRLAAYGGGDYCGCYVPDNPDGTPGEYRGMLPW